MKKLDRLDKTILTLSIMIVSLLLGMLTSQLILYRKVNMPESEYSVYDYRTAFYMLQDDYEYIPPSQQKDKKYYRETIEDLISLGPYLYFEVGMNGHDGASLVGLRTIIMNKNITDHEQYCVAFTHEVMHTKKFHGYEPYIIFETFKFLYESENEYLHNAGVRYGLDMLYGYYDGEYDCPGYIINYLTKEIL